MPDSSEITIPAWKVRALVKVAEMVCGSVVALVLLVALVASQSLVVWPVLFAAVSGAFLWLHHNVDESEPKVLPYFSAGAAVGSLVAGVTPWLFLHSGETEPMLGQFLFGFFAALLSVLAAIGLHALTCSVFATEEARFKAAEAEAAAGEKAPQSASEVAVLD